MSDNEGVIIYLPLGTQIKLTYKEAQKISFLKNLIKSEKFQSEYAMHKALKGKHVKKTDFDLPEGGK